MKRREWLRQVAAAAALAVPARAFQSEPYPGVRYRAYEKCLPEYYRAIALAAYEARNRELARLTSREAIAARQQWARRTFWDLIGGEPERTPLRARVMGKLERRGYRVENVVYESRPRFFVTANLYVPEGVPGPFPAVLVQMGHSPIGKAYAAYQRLCQGLVRLGFVVLGFDPMGQGERIYYPDSSGRKTRLGSPDGEHTMAGKQMLLAGDSATRMQTWDAVRSIDYLVSLPFVDASRIGTTGQSGGGTTSMFLVAADDRIAAAALCSANSENYCCAGYNAPGSTDDAEQNFPGSAPLGFDRWDMLYPFAPKPLLVSVSDKDFFGTYSPNYIADGWEEYQKLRRVYEVMGRRDAIAWDGTPLPHGLGYDTRLLVYNWMLRWLGRDGRRINEEPPTHPETEEDLSCTREVSAVRGLDSLTPHELLRVPEKKSPPPPLEQVLRLDRIVGQEFRVLRVIAGRGVRIEAVEIESAPGIFVPAWIFLPRPDARGKPLVVLLEPSGRNAAGWREDEMYQQLAEKGYAVCVPDLRMCGDTWPAMSTGNPRRARRANEEEEYGWAGLILGRPLLGQRVTDALAVLRACAAHMLLQGRPVMLAAQGKMTPVALCAAALEKPAGGQRQLYLSGGPITMAAGFRNPAQPLSMAHLLPNLLATFDFPDLLRIPGYRKVILAGMKDASGRPVPEAELASLTRGNPAVEIRQDSDWELGRFLQLAP